MAETAPATTNSNERILRGPEKVAALLLGMGKPLAGRLLKHFDARELKEISRSAAALGSVPVQMLEGLTEEFAAQFASGVDLLSTANEVEQLLQGVLTPEQIAEIMSDVMGSSNQSTWQRISAVPEAVIAAYLPKEHPQTVALILSKITSERAAKVLIMLERDLRNAVMRRLLCMKTPTEAAIRILETKLHDDLLITSSKTTTAQTNARLADIINKLQPAEIEDVLQSLSETKPKEAEVLKGLLFAFDDIVKLPQRARVVLFDKVPTERVVLALQGTDAPFRDVVLSSLASRARRLVENELNTAGNANPRDVAAARKGICETVLQLAEKGEIESGRPRKKPPRATSAFADLLQLKK